MGARRCSATTGPCALAGASALRQREGAAAGGVQRAAGQVPCAAAQRFSHFLVQSNAWYAVFHGQEADTRQTGVAQRVCIGDIDFAVMQTNETAWQVPGDGGWRYSWPVP